MSKEKPEAKTSPPAPAEPAVPESPQKDAERRTPEEWARKLGYKVATRVQAPDISDPVHGFHAAADVLHGWTVDAHHNQGEKALRLTEADYRKALEAASKYPTVAPHGPAIAPTCPHDHKAFKPKKPATAPKGAKTPKGGWRPLNEVI